MTVTDLSWQDEDWRELALCRQIDVGDVFFPEKGQSVGDAKRICMACDARKPCLDDALATDERFGVRGGLSERERRRLKRGETVVATLNNKPNRKANGHGHACKCFACMHIRNESA